MKYKIRKVENYMEEKKKGKGVAVISVILGIIGIVLSIIIFISEIVGIIGAVFGIIGAIFGIVAMIKSKGKSKMGIIGIILSIVAILIFMVLIYLLNMDTTPPTIKVNKTTFYIGDTIKTKELVTVNDQDDNGNETKENIKVEIGEIDTTTEGIKKVNIIATDKRKNQTKKEITINIVNPNITIYDYIQKNIRQKEYYTYTIENYGNDHFSIKNTTKDGDYGIIDFTEMTIKEYSHFGSFNYVDIMKFNNNLEITEIYRTSTLLGKVNNEYLYLSDDTAESTIKIQQTHFKYILGNLQSNNISIVGKTAEQLKNETIDIREVQ